MTLTKKELKQQTLANLRRGLDFLPDSSEEAAALVLELHIVALGAMRIHDYLSAEEAVMEVRTLYAAVEQAHPGKWEALGGQLVPDALKA
jgi:hypothetical protein